MVRELKIRRATSAMYAKYAEAQAAQAKAFKERLTNDCNVLLNELKEDFPKVNFDNVIKAQSISNDKLETLRTILITMKHYLKG